MLSQSGLQSSSVGQIIAGGNGRGAALDQIRFKRNT